MSKPKRLINFKIEEELHDWVKCHAAKNGTDVTKILVAYIKELRLKQEGIQSFLELVQRDFDCSYVITKEDGELKIEEVRP